MQARTRTVALGVMSGVVLLLGIGVAGCSDIQVDSAWAPQGAATSIGSSFAWMTDQAAPAKGGEAVNAPLKQLIRDAVEQGFVSKGYEARSSAPADFWIGCRMSKEILGDKYSARPFEQYTEGTMVIYVVDPATRNWLWRGRVETRLNDANSPEIKRARLREAVERVLKSFPSRGKSSATR